MVIQFEATSYLSLFCLCEFLNHKTGSGRTLRLINTHLTPSLKGTRGEILRKELNVVLTTYRE